MLILKGLCDDISTVFFLNVYDILWIWCIFPVAKEGLTPENIDQSQRREF